MTLRPKAIFQRDDKYKGVRRINIYLFRLVVVLMFFVLGKDTWTHILTHQGSWEPTDAMACCVWTAFAILAGSGMVRPLKMLPILPFEIFYKVLWLIIVPYPLWSTSMLEDSPAVGITGAFLWVISPIVAVAWTRLQIRRVERPLPNHLCWRLPRRHCESLEIVVASNHI